MRRGAVVLVRPRRQRSAADGARPVDPANNLILLEGNTSIEAPRNTSLELGATFSPDPSFTLAGTVYWSRLAHLMVEDFESVVRRSFQNDPDGHDLIGAELEGRWHLSDELTLTLSLTWLEWLSGAHGIDTNVGVPDQNARLTAGLRLYGLLANERWGYGLTGSFTSERHYNVRAGIPPQVLNRELPGKRSATVCVTEEGDKPKIYVNSSNGALENIRFSSNLLELTTIVR